MPRRILASRNTNWARALARLLARAGVRPNAVSVASVVFAACGGAAFYCMPFFGSDGAIAAVLVAAASIQLRLLCNLFDGMLAIEEGFKGKAGEVFNDLPDRLADVVILVGAGYAVRELAFGVVLGWAAATCALLTAYVRLLGGSLGLTQSFIGPMAKQHRMFTLTLTSLFSVVDVLSGHPPRTIAAGLALIVAGSIVTTIRRSRRILDEMEAR